MEVSDKKEKILKVIKKYDFDLRKISDSNKSYLVPNIPDEIMEKLIKNFDSNLAFNRVIAFYDTTLFSTAKAGFLFTSDGFYHKTHGKARYFAYKDLTNISLCGDYLKIDLHNSDIMDYKICESSLDLSVMCTLLIILKELDIFNGFTSNKSSGKIKPIDLPPNAILKCNAIIHTAAVSCGGVGAGLAQIPASDNAVIVPIQITMIVSLGKVFDLDITEAAAKSIIASVGATVAGRTTSQVLIGWIPGIGNVVNTATAAGITEAIGWIAVKDFIERRKENLNKGRFEGMKEGYAAASEEYERKLNNQAEEFLSQKKEFQKEREEYENLLEEYEKYIVELERKGADIQRIQEAKDTYGKLSDLSA